MSEKITYRSILEECAKTNNWVDVPTHEEQIELAKRVSAGDEGAIEEMIIRNRKLVYKLQAQEKYKHFPSDTILSAGMAGLASAVKGFNYTSGYKFSTYADKCIRNEISKEIQKMVELKEDASKVVKNLEDAIDTLRMKLHREPNIDEIAAELKCENEKVIIMLELARRKKSLSLNASYGDDDNSKDLEDYIVSDEYSIDALDVVYHSPEEADFDKLRVYAGYGSEVFSSAYKNFNPKVLCKAFPKYHFRHKYADGEGSILLSYPIISRIKTSVIVIGNKKSNTIALLKACTEDRFKECSEETLVNYFINMYDSYYKSRSNLKHSIGGEITQEQKELIFNKYPDSSLCNEIKEAKSWGDISVYSIFKCAIKRFANGENRGQINLSGTVKNFSMFPAGEKIFPWNREHFRKISGWISGEHSSHNNEDAKRLFNDFISALVFKGDINWNFKAKSSEFNEYLHKISLLRNAILQAKAPDPTMLYMRSIEDICSVYCIKNGYPLPEYEALLAVLEKVQKEAKHEMAFVSEITTDGESLDAWKSLTQVVSNDLMNIFLSDKEAQKERLEEYVKSNPFVVHVKRNNSIHNAIREQFNAKNIPNFIHQCVANLEAKIKKITDSDNWYGNFACFDNDFDKWLKATFDISLEKISDEEEKEKFECEQFRNYLGYNSKSMKYVRNIIIATLFETQEDITKKEINQALLKMGFARLNPTASTFDAIISQAIDLLNQQPEIVDEIRRDVLGEAVDIW